MNNLQRSYIVDAQCVVEANEMFGFSLVEFASYPQYLKWLRAHAIIEYFMRVLPIWKRWEQWHRYHHNQVPILTINYGHSASSDSTVAHFFA